MQHPLAGIHRTIKAHVGLAIAHTAATNAQPLSYFQIPEDERPKSVTNLIGPFMRARKSLTLLGDVLADTDAAIAILEGRQPEQLPVMVKFLSAIACDAAAASEDSRAAAVADLKLMRSEIQVALSEATQRLAEEGFPAAKTVINKAASVGGLDLQSLLRGDGDALQLMQGTAVYAALPDTFKRERTPLTKAQEALVTEYVSRSYRKHLDDEAYLKDEFAKADKRLAEKLAKQKAVAALADLAKEI